ncbi:MAG TPA: hypothetical protein VK157_07910 [Phycisphaerales bacterium]|nr:hypothetical protein [Phycisphaerales bacterium]
MQRRWAQHRRLIEHPRNSSNAISFIRFFVQVTFTKSERSELASLAATRL